MDSSASPPSKKSPERKVGSSSPSYSHLLGKRKTVDNSNINYGDEICAPIPSSVPRRSGYFLNRIIFERDQSCIDMLRMDRSTFHQLCRMIRKKNLLSDTSNVTLEEQLAWFLHNVGHNSSFESIGVLFDQYHPKETVRHYFYQVLSAICQLQADSIKLPDSAIDNEVELEDKYWPWFKDCIGAIGGTRMHKLLPAKTANKFCIKKDHSTQNVLVAVTLDLKFSYVLIGWEGFASDATVLLDAVERPTGLRVPDGKYFLVAPRFNTTPGFIGPYLGVRRNNIPTDMKELFNLRHFTLRSPVGRAFGIFKNRFRILSTDDHYENHLDIALACFFLHNLIIGMNSGDVFRYEVIRQEEGQARTLKRQREDNTEWVSKKDAIANDMWNDFNIQHKC